MCKFMCKTSLSDFRFTNWSDQLFSPHQIVSMTFFNFCATSPAMPESAGFPIRSIPASGSTAETSTPFAFSCTITLQGSIAPILSSACNA